MLSPGHEEKVGIKFRFSTIWQASEDLGELLSLGGAHATDATLFMRRAQCYIQLKEPGKAAEDLLSAERSCFDDPERRAAISDALREAREVC